MRIILNVKNALLVIEAKINLINIHKFNRIITSIK